MKYRVSQLFELFKFTWWVCVCVGGGGGGVLFSLLMTFKFTRKVTLHALLVTASASDREFYSETSYVVEKMFSIRFKCSSLCVCVWGWGGGWVGCGLFCLCFQWRYCNSWSFLFFLKLCSFSSSLRPSGWATRQPGKALASPLHCGLVNNNSFF